MLTSHRYGVTAERHPSLTWKTGTGLDDGAVCAVATDVNAVALANNAAKVIFLPRVRLGSIWMIVIEWVWGRFSADNMRSLKLVSIKRNKRISKQV